MNFIKLIFVLNAILLYGLSANASCYWVKVDDRFMECRTPLNRMVLSEKSYSQLMQTILLNSQNYLNRVFNNSEVLDIVTGGQPLDTRLVEQARDTLAKSDQTVDLLNQLTSIAEVVQAPDELSRSLMPAALIFGVTISIPQGIPLPSPIANLFRASGSLTVGGGSVLLAVVTVPYVVEFVAEKLDTQDEAISANPLTVFFDRSSGVKVYRTDLPFYQRFGVEHSLRLFPNLDLKVSSKGPAARVYKTSKSLINVGAAWGSSILRPSDLGPWGLSYTQPTASHTLTPIFNSLYSNSFMKRIQPLANYSLATLNRLGVDTLKVSTNSRTEFWGREFHSFDQTIILLRRSIGRGDANADLSPSGRFGVNLGLDLLESINIFGNVLASVERAGVERSLEENERPLNPDQGRLQLHLRQSGFSEEPINVDEQALPPPIPFD